PVPSSPSCSSDSVPTPRWPPLSSSPPSPTYVASSSCSGWRERCFCKLVLLPKLFTTLQTYTRAQFVADLTAGIIVGIVALPLAIAFAIASGVTPERGLYTAVIAGFL